MKLHFDMLVIGFILGVAYTSYIFLTCHVKVKMSLSGSYFPDAPN